MGTTMSNEDKYRVQTRYDNPEAIVQHSGKQHRWIDASAHHTKSEAQRACRPDQRVIKLCTPSEGALLMDTGAYRGRRFNIIQTREAT